MKRICIIALLLALLAGCGTATPEQEITEATTTEASTVLTSTEAPFSEETRKNMDADHALWHKNKDAAIKRAEDELTAKGWNGLAVSTFSEARYMFMYSIEGHVDDKFDNPMAISAMVIFSELDPEGGLGASYTSEAGRIYYGNEIFSVDDPRLYDYMRGDSSKWRKNVDAALKRIESELTQKSWSGIAVNQTKEEPYEYIYEIVGQVGNEYDNPMYVEVYITFNAFTPEGKIDFVTNRSALDTRRVYNSGIEILSANDQQLYDHFH